MINVIVVAIIVICALWVYWDATGNRIGKIPGAGGMLNMSAGAFAAVTMFLWIVGFPAYVIKRSAMIERAKGQPVEVKGRIIKMAVLAVVGGLWVLGTLAGAMAPPPQAGKAGGEQLRENVRNPVEQKGTPATPAKPAAAAPKAEVALTPPQAPAATAAEAAKPAPAVSPSPARADDPAALDRAIAASKSRASELEKNVSDLQKLVDLKNKQIAELEKKEAAKK